LFTQSNTNTNTDFDGNFSVNAKVGEILKISMLGFDPITANATLDLMTITMMESQDTALKEVVSLGTVRKKVDNTTAIVSLKQKRFLERFECFSSYSR
jgi:hypothetical protein